MTELFLPKTNERISSFANIQKLLQSQGVEFTRWQAQIPLMDSASQADVLQAYEHELKPFMKKHGFKSADVINVHPGTPNLSTLREKFLKEHTHSEDEVRFFVDGSGVFWFHFDDGVIARLTCHKGDFLSVPKGFKHWFDLAPGYFVKAIRIFTDETGWVANYTNSGAEKVYGDAQ